MGADQLAAIGAFLSGMGSVIAAAIFIRRVRRSDEAECEKRLDALREGIRLERER